MRLVIFGAEGRIGSLTVKCALRRGHTVVCAERGLVWLAGGGSIEERDSRAQVKRDVHTNTEAQDVTELNVERVGSTNAEARDVTALTASRNGYKHAEGRDVTALTAEQVGQVDGVVDFSTAEATREVCDFCRAHRCPLVTGVTGRTETQQQLIEELARVLPVSAKNNFSRGAQTLRRLVEVAAHLSDWDCDIVELHRRGKKDAPSGTAKELAAVAAQRGSFRAVTVHSLRCGDSVGTHTVIFATNGERLVLTHEAQSAEIFADGAVAEAERLITLAQNVPHG